ncbi:MAG TPA: hypothetical protein VFA93_03010 [Patescibacteria group bacterium]|nr:hypothetical protein [Patescibacteria group bacterium]
MNRYYNGILWIFVAFGLQFLRSSYGKIAGGKFVGGLSATLRSFANKNPNDWYKNFLDSWAIPNSTILGNLIMWGELLSGIAMTVGSLYLFLNKGKGRAAQVILVLGLIGGAILNFNFYFAAGWTGPSTEGLNLLMLVIEIVGIAVFGKSLLK